MVGREANRLLRGNGDFRGRQLVDGRSVSRRGMKFLRRVARFATESKPEQDDNQTRAAPDCAEETKSREVERTEGSGRTSHGEWAQDRRNWVLSSTKLSKQR